MSSPWVYSNESVITFSGSSTNGKKASEFGISVEGTAGINFLQAQERKQAIVDQLEKGIHQLFKQGKIDLFVGTGTILGPSIFSPTAGTISVEFEDGSENEMLIPKT